MNAYMWLDLGLHILVALIGLAGLWLLYEICRAIWGIVDALENLEEFGP